MNFFFINADMSLLADKKSDYLQKIRNELLTSHEVDEVHDPSQADIVLIEEEFSYKDFRYIDNLLNDSIIHKHLDKVFTINKDDCATGLLRGLYTSLPKTRFNGAIHTAIPYLNYPNELVLKHELSDSTPNYLASWRGNTKSNLVRKKIIKQLENDQRFVLETTESWLNHNESEKEAYVKLITNSKFSLCPAGWAPVSFRIYESMALSRCPVIIADEFVPPAGPDWKNFAVFYSENRIDKLAAHLSFLENDYQSLGHSALLAWRTFFSPEITPSYMSKSLLSLARSSPTTSKEKEVNRWKSLSLYWNNNWTLPQRIFNKSKQIIKLS